MMVSYADIHGGCKTKSVGRFSYQDLCSAGINVSVDQFIMCNSVFCFSFTQCNL